MSYNNPGGAYIPPPPAADRRRSPWLFVGIGCGALALLAVVAMAIFIGNLSKNIQAEMKKPYDIAQVKRSLKDAPQYPNSQFDETMSKAVRAGMSTVARMMPADETVVIAYKTTDAPDKVIGWYDDAMPKKGYTADTAGQMPGRAGVQQAQYKKGNDRVLVQAQSQEQGTIISVIRFNGFKGN
jgi:hypothetical protein